MIAFYLRKNPVPAFPITYEDTKQTLTRAWCPEPLAWLDEQYPGSYALYPKIEMMIQIPEHETAALFKLFWEQSIEDTINLDDLQAAVKAV